VSEAIIDTWSSVSKRRSLVPGGTGVLKCINIEINVITAPVGSRPREVSVGVQIEFEDSGDTVSNHSYVNRDGWAGVSSRAGVAINQLTVIVMHLDIVSSYRWVGAPLDVLNGLVIRPASIVVKGAASGTSHFAPTDLLSTRFSHPHIELRLNDHSVFPVQRELDAVGGGSARGWTHDVVDGIVDGNGVGGDGHGSWSDSSGESLAIVQLVGGVWWANWVNHWAERLWVGRSPVVYLLDVHHIDLAGFGHAFVGVRAECGTIVTLNLVAALQTGELATRSDLSRTSSCPRPVLADLVQLVNRCITTEVDAAGIVQLGAPASVSEYLAREGSVLDEERG